MAKWRVRSNSRPREDNRGDGLVHLKDKVHREQALLVLVSSGHGVHGSGGREREAAHTDEDGRLARGNGHEVGGDDVGDDADRTGDHVVQDCLEFAQTEPREDERCA